MRFLRWLILSAPILMALSGCGNSGSSVKPPSALSYSAGSAVYTKGVAIAPDNPAVGSGSITSFSVSPALPAGLVLDPGTGIVSGTPAVVAATASYTVTGTGAGGSTTATLSIKVNDQAPTALSYAAGTSSYIVATPITPNFPTNTGGTVVSYSVTPALPGGLSLSRTTGVISGSPAIVTAATNYTVKASNSGGSATATLNIAPGLSKKKAGTLANAGPRTESPPWPLGRCLNPYIQ